MSLAEILKEEGRLEALHQVARDLLKNGTDPVFVAKITKLSLDQIKKIQANK